ncbi:MAG: hypothetical protein ACR2FI_11580 [Burkholderiales bacterium]
MQHVAQHYAEDDPKTENRRYAKCIENSKRVSWDIDIDVIRGREFDVGKSFLPDGLTKLVQLGFLDANQKRLASQIQGRTYANMFGLVERFINTKILEVSEAHRGVDPIALEALLRFSDEELKHQELFRRIVGMIANRMPPGYRFLPQAAEVASVVLGKSSWAVLALTCLIELFTLAHYRQSIAPDSELSDLYKDVFLFHWKEESQHAILDELEWKREDAKLAPGQRDRAVDDLIALVAAVDGILQAQAASDANYFLTLCNAAFAEFEVERVKASMLEAYRFQYIASGVEQPRFQEILASLITPEQSRRIDVALAPILG